MSGKHRDPDQAPFVDPEPTRPIKRPITPKPSQEPKPRPIRPK